MTYDFMFSAVRFKIRLKIKTNFRSSFTEKFLLRNYNLLPNLIIKRRLAKIYENCQRSKHLLISIDTAIYMQFN